MTQKVKKNSVKRLFTMLMVIAMLFTMIPEGSAWADDEGTLAEAKLSSLEIALGSYSSTSPEELSFKTDFEKDTFTYETDFKTPTNISYQGYDDNFHIKATATDANATIEAKFGDGTVAVVSGSTDWKAVTKKVMYWGSEWDGSNPLTIGKNNTLTVTVTNGNQTQDYTITVPVKPSLKWKTNAPSGGCYEKGSEVSLEVEAAISETDFDEYKRVTYQWYKNTSKSEEGATEIAGATNAKYTVKESEHHLDTPVYYFAKATFASGDVLTSKIAEVTFIDFKKPESITVSIVSDMSNKRAKNGTYILKKGDVIDFKAVDQDGKETPVTWSGAPYCGTLDQNGRLTITQDMGWGGTSYAYVVANSKFSGGPKGEADKISMAGYKHSSNTINLTLSTDGQKNISGSFKGGVDGETTWSYDEEAAKGIAVLTSDIKTKGTSLQFDALRPGSFTAVFKVDFNDEMTDTQTMNITGIAVEDQDGTQRKTEVTVNTGKKSDAQVQLTAYCTDKEATLTWSSKDGTVATVDENGRVTGLKAGNTIISVTDGKYTGGIKVVVNDEATPYFENISFQKGSMGSDGISADVSFQPTTLNYTGISLTRAVTNDLVFLASTSYNTKKYDAHASYTDRFGNTVEEPINSGSATTLSDMAFGTSVVSVILADKSDTNKKTTYTFEITRQRDTGKVVAGGGFVLLPNGRELSSNKYNDQAEGVMFVANEDGSLASSQGVSSSSYYYRTFAQNGLESFSLRLKAATNYAHIRYSIDDGQTWNYAGQGSGLTKLISFPEREDENPEIKVIIQILDDKTYSENVAAGKDGFEGSKPNSYSIWLEQLPIVDGEIIQAETDQGNWYPAFSPKYYNYYTIVVEETESAPTIKFKVTDGAAVKVGGNVLSPDGDGYYTVLLTSAAQDVIVEGKKGARTYKFSYSQKKSSLVPDKVTDYLPINSQYTNTGQFGMYPEQILYNENAMRSIGNFGGYVTFYYEKPLVDNPNNKYGVDLYIRGNAFRDTISGTGHSSMEPGQVWVSENGKTWYALAGSEHYEETTLWDYKVTYKKTADGKTTWTDNYGNHDNGSQVGSWPTLGSYPLNSLIKSDTVTLSGILIPCIDGSLTGDVSFSSMSMGGRFGYVDVLPNNKIDEEVNPYLDNDKYQLDSSGFDLAWAVDESGTPIDVSNKEFHYVKVVTASNLWAGAANEKSTEVSHVLKTQPQASAVGKTTRPSGLKITDGLQEVSVVFNEKTQVYEANIGNIKYASLTVLGTSADDNIYINNERVASGEASAPLKVTKENDRLVRVLVQNGEKEPDIVLVKLKGTADNSNDLISGVKVDVSGSKRIAETRDGKTYTSSVGYRIQSIGINVVSAPDAEVKINDAKVKDSYAVSEGENVFNITASKGNITHSVVLKVEKEKAPAVTGKITVSFSLYGDDKHGTVEESHTYAAGQMKAWIPEKTYSLDAPATVLDVFEMALREKGLTWVNSGGNYVSEINGLAEFDNGPNSGWMYLVNGQYPDTGLAEKTIKQGDSIVWHYTDDWKKEKGQDAWNQTTEEQQTETRPDGTIITTEEKPDGTVVITEKRPDGTTVKTETTPDGKTTSKVTLPEGKGKTEIKIPVDLGDEDGRVAVKITNSAGEKTVSVGYSNKEVSLNVYSDSTIEILDEFVPLSELDIPAGVEATTIKAKSVLGKKSIKILWTKSKGYRVDYYQIFRSTKRYSGYGVKPFFTTKSGDSTSYTNTKSLKKGTTYYYKVRGVRVIDGKKYYTKWSTKAYRTFK